MLKTLERPMPKSRFTSEVVLITPDIARAWLDKNVLNRKVASGTVLSYARDMKQKHWRLTGDAIRFDANSNLIDGQHRLLACIASETPFESVVVYGLDPATQDQIDTGRPRKISDMFTLHGHHNVNVLAATLRILEELRIGGDNARRTRLTHAEAQALLGRHPQLEASVRAVINCKVGPPRPILATVHYIGSTKLNARDRADAFIEVMLTGEPSYSGDPAHKLRERILRDKAARSAIKRDEGLRATMHAWNLFAKKKKMDILRWPKEASFDGLDVSKL